MLRIAARPARTITAAPADRAPSREVARPASPRALAPMIGAMIVGLVVAPNGAASQAAASQTEAKPSASSTATALQPTPSGLPLPRFVSLKSDRVNLRRGPSTDYPTLWVYRRAGLPVEVLAEVEGWRQIRDSDGATGWVLQSLLSRRRTALITPWDVKADQPPPLVPLRADDRDSAAVVAEVEAGVIATVKSCDRRWCLVTVGEFRGYIEQKKLWGVYDGETVR